ncbi:MAG: hypothetical protein ACLUKN_00925 [Bacilli bacterium]
MLLGISSAGSRNGSRPLYDEVESAFADVLGAQERDEADEILRSAGWFS